MSKTKEILICLLAVTVLALALTTNVFASDASSLLNTLANSNANNDVQNIPTRNENVNANVNANTNVNTNVNNSNVNNTNLKANNNASTSNAAEHADAGVDYSIVFIIAVCGISAIYAYKKIRDYNV
ncbi:MAG: hypothetical protein ACI4UX_01460 [Clostridia bacterium]